MKITFNTGRAYTAEGQIIVAKRVAGAVLFRDLSRCVAGRIDVPEGLEFLVDTPHDLERYVVSAYDGCQYESDERADALDR